MLPNLPNYAVAPGEYLAEWLASRNISELFAAGMLGCRPAQLEGILAGRVVVDGDLAARLETLTGIRASSWLTWESAYNSELVRLSARRPELHSAKRPA